MLVCQWVEEDANHKGTVARISLLYGDTPKHLPEIFELRRWLDRLHGPEEAVSRSNISVDQEVHILDVNCRVRVIFLKCHRLKYSLARLKESLAR